MTTFLAKQDKNKASVVRERKGTLENNHLRDSTQKESEKPINDIALNHTLVAFVQCRKLNIKRHEDLEYWSKQVTFRGVLVKLEGKSYRVPHGIFKMMEIINTPKVNDYNKQLALSDVGRERNKKGTFFCLPFFKLYRKKLVNQCYITAKELALKDDEKTPLITTTAFVK